ANPVPDRKRGADGALGVVLVRNGCTEERHHGVADELLHCAAVALQLLAQPGVVGRKRCTDILRVEPLRLRGEAYEVGKEHADDLPFLARRLRGSELGAAMRAARETLGRLLPAGGTDDHAEAARSASPSAMNRLAPTER